MIVGAQPEEGSSIPGIRKWPPAYLPKIFDRQRVDRVENVSQAEAEDMARRLAREEGIFAASRPAAHARSRCGSRAKSSTRRSYSSSAIVATATCRPAYFRLEQALTGVKARSGRRARNPRDAHSRL